MISGRGLLSCAFAGALFGCQNLDKFDTPNGAAYCGSIASAQFIRTVTSEGGFQRDLRLSLVLDTNHLTTVPGYITTDDKGEGDGGDPEEHPCGAHATFEHAKLEVTQEVVSDSLSMMTFEEGQVQNVIAWTRSTCRGPMLAIVSLLKNDHVDVRLLKPRAEKPSPGERDAFAFFPLSRSASGCGF